VDASTIGKDIFSAGRNICVPPRQDVSTLTDLYMRNLASNVNQKPVF
jgi:hypothetical protein